MALDEAPKYLKVWGLADAVCSGGGAGGWLDGKGTT